MTTFRRAFQSVALLMLSGATIAAELIPDQPHACDACEAWGKPHEPFRIYGDTWYVGGGLTSILITSDRGHVLIDGGLTQTAPQIAANIAKLGFKLEDVKLILNSHTHYDHAGGIAALQRASGAQVAASPASKLALEGGGPTRDDPQFAFGPEHNNFPPVRDVRTIQDGETLRIGDIAITAHFTPGHTPGGTSWTWNDCDGDMCMPFVYADSLNSVSAPGFRFSGDNTHKSRVASFRASIDKVAKLDCSILLTPHPEFMDLDAKLAVRAAQKPGERNPFLGDRQDCKRYAAGARERLDKRVAGERTPQ